MVQSELTRYKSVRAKTLDLLSGLSQEDLDRAPGPGRWSVGEIADHVLRVEDFYRREISELIRKVDASGSARLQRGFADFEVRLRLFPRAFLPLIELPMGLANLATPRGVREFLMKRAILPADSPGSVRPRHGRPGGELRRDLEGSLERTLELFERHRHLDFRRLIHSHPLLGRNDAVGLLRLMVLHEERHQAQIAAAGG
jgi:hypothetical protein